MLEGTATDKIIHDFNEKRIDYNGPYKSLDDMLSQLKADLLKKPLTNDKIVVFSPGATSFGMFTNEFDRGNQFKSKVKALFV